MKDKINWLEGWINVVIKITDISINYSYSERRDKLDHKCMDHIILKGEAVFSDYKHIKNGDNIEI